MEQRRSSTYKHRVFPRLLRLTLEFLAPGAMDLAQGRVWIGVLRCGLSSVGLGCLLLAVVKAKMFFLAGAMVWTVYQAILMSTALGSGAGRRTNGPAGPGRRLPVVLLSGAVAFVPLTAAMLVFLSLVGFGTIQTPDSVPLTYPGEVISYDRVSSGEGLGRGTLVVVECRSGNGIGLARVGGLPSEVVRDDGTEVCADWLCFSPNWFGTIDEGDPPVSSGVELWGDRFHIVYGGGRDSSAGRGEAQQTYADIELSTDEFYLLPDTRPGDSDRLCGARGRIDGSRILGVPRFVAKPSQLRRLGLTIN